MLLAWDIQLQYTYIGNQMNNKENVKTFFWQSLYYRNIVATDDSFVHLIKQILA